MASATAQRSQIVEEFLGRPLAQREDPWCAVMEAMQAADDTRPYQVINDHGHYYVVIVEWSGDFSDEDNQIDFPEPLIDFNSFIPQRAGIIDSCGGHIAA